MTEQFAGSTVLVTGAGTGIGRAVAEAFGHAGANIVVTGRTANTLDETVRVIEHDGGRALAVTADVRDPASVASLVASTVDTFGTLDIAVNSAGILTASGPVADIDEQQWADLLATNLTGLLLCMQHEIRHMRRVGGGVIVNISSTIGTHKRVPGMGAYAAAKAGVTALSRAAALDHIADGIRINTVSPGPVDTPGSYRPGESRADRDTRARTQIPTGRVATLDEIAAAVLYLASPQASFHIGTDLVIDGGSTA